MWALGERLRLYRVHRRHKRWMAGHCVDPGCVFVYTTTCTDTNKLVGSRAVFTLGWMGEMYMLLRIWREWWKGSKPNFDEHRLTVVISFKYGQLECIVVPRSNYEHHSFAHLQMSFGGFLVLDWLTWLFLNRILIPNQRATVPHLLNIHEHVCAIRTCANKWNKMVHSAELYARVAAYQWAPIRTAAYLIRRARLRHSSHTASAYCSPAKAEVHITSYNCLSGVHIWMCRWIVYYMQLHCRALALYLVISLTTHSVASKPDHASDNIE